MEMGAIAGPIGLLAAWADERSEDAENAVIGVERFPPLDGMLFSFAEPPEDKSIPTTPTQPPTTNQPSQPGAMGNGAMG